MLFIFLPNKRQQEGLETDVSLAPNCLFCR